MPRGKELPLPLLVMQRPQIGVPVAVCFRNELPSTPLAEIRVLVPKTLVPLTEPTV